MNKILFVDDEPHVQQGLQRMLRSMRQEWHMAFAGSGQQALDILSQDSFDVVVSDMRMPGMNGAQLLTEVKKQHPEMVRIILSGQSDQEALLRSVGPTHQFLSKPCEAETLKAVIVRACALRQLLRDDAILELISQLESLPSLPSLYMEMVDVLQNADATISKVVEIISQDVGMTAKILQLVNSGFFGVARRVTDVSQAVSLIGLDTIRALVLSFHIFSEYTAPIATTFSVETLSSHSWSVGRLAQMIAKSCGAETNVVHDALTAGLLHDAGQLALATNLSARYDAMLKRVQAEDLSIIDAEQETFGATHAEVGAYLAGLWGLPDTIVETLALHHTPSKSLIHEFSALTAVHVADFLEHERHGDCDDSHHCDLDTDYLASLGLLNQLPVWRALAMGDTQ